MIPLEIVKSIHWLVHSIRRSLQYLESTFKPNSQSNLSTFYLFFPTFFFRKKKETSLFHLAHLKVMKCLSSIFRLLFWITPSA